MVELWKVCCFESDEEKWSKEVHLSEKDMRTLLQMLLCRTLEPHEVIDAVTGKRDHLLEIRQEGNGMSTAGPNLMRYTARKRSSDET